MLLTVSVQCSDGMKHGHSVDGAILSVLSKLDNIFSITEEQTIAPLPLPLSGFGRS